MGRALADLCKFTDKKPGAGADQICLGSAALVLNAVDDADADAVVQVNVGQELLPSLLYTARCFKIKGLDNVQTPPGLLDLNVRMMSALPLFPFRSAVTVQGFL